MMSRNETESVQGEDSIVDKKVRIWVCEMTTFLQMFCSLLYRVNRGHDLLARDYCLHSLNDWGLKKKAVIPIAVLMLQVRQWGEIHALSRRMSYSNFMSLARQKREEVEEVLRSLEDGMPASVEAIAEKMEVLQEGALWFPGGSKEMKVCVGWGVGGGGGGGCFEVYLSINFVQSYL